MLTLTLIYSCANRNIKYDRNKILKEYSVDYKVFVVNEKVHLETLYLNKDNIASVRIYKQKKELKITQRKSTEILELKNLNLDSLYTGQRS